MATDNEQKSGGLLMFAQQAPAIKLLLGHAPA